MGPYRSFRSTLVRLLNFKVGSSRILARQPSHLQTWMYLVPLPAPDAVDGTALDEVCGLLVAPLLAESAWLAIGVCACSALGRCKDGFCLSLSLVCG
jgi:hypothetical protein